mmetsp:Transcript_48670/g.112792  ORF Transcript_48670/g.112792 Transcript_48670/m.112792 type:complete len:236 (+) Transcript_48670:189-896(+)
MVSPSSRSMGWWRDCALVSSCRRFWNRLAPRRFCILTSFTCTTQESQIFCCFCAGTVGWVMSPVAQLHRRSSNRCTSKLKSAKPTNDSASCSACPVVSGITLEKFAARGVGCEAARFDCVLSMGILLLAVKKPPNSTFSTIWFFCEGIVESTVPTQSACVTRMKFLLAMMLRCKYERKRSAKRFLANFRLSGQVGHLPQARLLGWAMPLKAQMRSVCSIPRTVRAGSVDPMTDGP